MNWYCLECDWAQRANAPAPQGARCPKCGGEAVADEEVVEKIRKKEKRSDH